MIRKMKWYEKLLRSFVVQRDLLICIINMHMIWGLRLQHPSLNISLCIGKYLVSLVHARMGNPSLLHKAVHICVKHFGRMNLFYNKWFHITTPKTQLVYQNYNTRKTSELFCWKWARVDISVWKGLLMLVGRLGWGFHLTMFSCKTSKEQSSQLHKTK